MSVMELSPRHLAVCLIPLVPDASADALAVAGLLLRRANTAALRAVHGPNASVYGDEGAPTKREVMAECTARRYSPTEILKALQSFAYQACDAPSWETSEAKALVERLLGATIARLPGYETAKWIID